MADKKLKLVSNASLERANITSDGMLYYRTTKGEIKPVPVIRHGALGTQNQNVKGDTEVVNLIETETAKTGEDAKTLIVSFSFKPIALQKTGKVFIGKGKDEQEDANAMRAAIGKFIEQALESDSLVEVATRIAQNVLTGRWLWRNTRMAEKVSISVSDKQGGDIVVGFDALALDREDFESGHRNEEVKKLGTLFSKALRGQTGGGVRIEAEIDFGVEGAIEVFCSQNYIPGASTGDGPSRSLYKLPWMEGEQNMGGLPIVGHAAFRDAKIWNALRTIDTWYPEYPEIGKAIPVEPFGASKAHGRFFRKNKKSLYDLLKVLPSLDIESDDAKYVIASIIRGGLINKEGESKKSTAKKTDK